VARPIATIRGLRLVPFIVSFALAISAIPVALPGGHLARADGGCADCESDPIPPPPPPPDPEPRSEGDAFVGQAALFNHDGQVVDSGGSACPGCEWRLQKACELGGNVLCHELMRCGENDDGSHRWVHDVFLLRPGGGGWNQVGTLCLGDPDDALTPDDVWSQVQTRWRTLVPAQAPTLQPPDGQAVTELPTYFHSGQPRLMPAATVPVFNFEVTVTARGEWEWTLEPGFTREFDIPGNTYTDANPQVVHTYETTGARTVTLTTRWWGSFTVGDRGPYDIETPATQGPYDIPLDVVELGPVLGR
jgi:hypothetical protein